MHRISSLSSTCGHLLHPAPGLLISACIVLFCLFLFFQSKWEYSVSTANTIHVTRVLMCLVKRNLNSSVWQGNNCLGFAGWFWFLEMGKITHVGIKSFYLGQAPEWSISYPNIKQRAVHYSGWEDVSGHLDCTRPQALTPQMDAPGYSPQITDTPAFLMLPWENRSQQTSLPTPFYHQIPHLFVAVAPFVHSFLLGEYQRSLRTAGQDPIPSLPLRNFIPSMCCFPSMRILVFPFYRIIAINILHALVSPVQKTYRTTPLDLTAPLSTQPHQLRFSELLPANLVCTSSPPIHSSALYKSLEVTEALHSLKSNEELSSQKTTLSFMKHPSTSLHSLLFFLLPLVHSHSPLWVLPLLSNSNCWSGSWFSAMPFLFLHDTLCLGDSIQSHNFK